MKIRFIFASPEVRVICAAEGNDAVFVKSADRRCGVAY